MEITGRQLLSLALDLIDSGDEGLGPDLDNLERLAAHSVVVFDSLNVSPETSVGGVVRVRIPLPVGRTEFTWGPGGDVTRPLPTSVEAWSVGAAGGERDADGNLRTHLYRGTRLWTTEEWAAYSGVEQDGDEVYGLFWPKTLDSSGRYTFHVYPRTQAATELLMWVTIPKVDRIELDETYQLDPGRGQYLQASLAVAFAPVIGLPVHPSVYDILRNATARLGNFSVEEEVQHVPSARYLNFSGDFYGYY